ncbi:MAG: HEPN domain-containing protein [Bacteroidetes bacterium]|nr:MAG: HEPN domain-containing protein [Bacteroidota bacterium]
MPSNELVQSWLLKAARDLETAKIVASHMPDFDDVIAFHCQQAIEKSLKGYLVFLDVEFKPVHDLGYLLNLTVTKDGSFDMYFEEVDRVSRYAVQIRYPDSIINLTSSQIQEAITMADLIFTLVKEKTF